MVSIEDDSQAIQELRALHAHAMTDEMVLGALFQEKDRGQDFVSGNSNYLYWWALGLHFRPRRIAEIGTRYGYSLKALTKGAGHPPALYGLRVWDGEVDPDGATLHVFEKHFRELGVWDIRVTRANTRSLTALEVPGGPVDMAVVDADHSTEGALADMRLLAPHLRPRGIMVVDDSQPGTVADAVTRFVAETGWPMAYLPTLRGVAILKKPE